MLHDSAHVASQKRKRKISENTVARLYLHRYTTKHFEWFESNSKYGLRHTTYVWFEYGLKYGLNIVYSMVWIWAEYGLSQSAPSAGTSS